MTRMDPATWAAFCAQPNEEKFTPLYEQSQGLVWTLCWRILRDEEEAQDAFQGVYARLLAHARAAKEAAGAKAGGEAIDRLIYQCAVREAHCLRLRRTRRRQKEVVMDTLPQRPAEELSARQTAAEAQERAQLQALVATLPEKYRLPLELHYFHGLTQAEIAAMMGRSQGTISQNLARGLRLLEPLAERAGLRPAAALLGVATAGAALCGPPAAQAAGVVFAQAQALVAAGGIAAGAGGLATLKAMLGSALAGGKMAAPGAVALAVVASGVFFGPTLYSRVRASEKAPVTVIVSSGSQATPTPAAPAEPVKAASRDGSGEPAGNQATAHAPRKPAVPGAVVTGRVFAQAGGRPVAGVKIRVQPENVWKTLKETQSDAGGFYRLEGLPLNGKLEGVPLTGRLAVVAQPADHAWQARLVSTSMATHEATCDFILEPAGEAEVKVSDTAGRPVAGASIRVDDQTSVYNQLKIKTDATGRALVRNLDLIRSTYLRIDKVGYDGGESQVLQFPAGRLRTSLAFVITPLTQGGGDVVTGLVTDPAGAPLAGITVQWGVDGGGSGTSRTTTGPDGRYSLTTRNMDDYQQLMAYGKGWATQCRRKFKSTDPARPAELNLTMQPGHWFGGVVVDGNGKPLPGIEICVEGTAPDYPRFPDAQGRLTTNARGRFRAEGLPTGVRLVAGDRNVYPYEYVENPTPDRELRIVLKPAGKIRGRVIDQATRRPVPGFTIHLSAMSVGGDRAHSGQAFTDPEGRFEVAGLKQSERCEFTIDAPGYPQQIESNVRVEAPESKEERTFELAQGSRLRGLLVDRDSGSPVAGAEIVYALVDERFGFSWDYLRRDIGSAKILERQTSDAKGAFTLSAGKERGTILLLPKQHQRQVIRFAEREKFLVGNTLLARLGPAATLEGKALRNGAPVSGAFIGLGRGGVRFASETISSPSDSQRSQADGAFRFAGLAPGDYQMTAQYSLESPVHQTYQRKLKISEGERKTFNIGDGLGACTLSGAVRDRGKAAPKIIIELTPQFEWDYTRIAGASDAKGAFTIPGLRPGAYKAKLRQEPGSLTPGEKPLDLETTVRVDAGLTAMRRDFEFQQGHVARARLTYPAGTPPAAAGALAYGALRLKDAPFTLDKGIGGIDISCQGRIEREKIAFEGTLKGQYQMQLTFGVSPRDVSWTLPRPFTLDTTTADQELGEIALPATGVVRCQLHYATAAPELPAQVVVSLGRAGSSEAPTGMLYLDPKKEDQVAGPIPVGTHEFRTFSPGYKVEPAMGTLTVKPGGEAGPLKLTLIPTGCLMGGVGVQKQGKEEPKPIQADQITLSGPGYAKTLKPVAMKDLAALQGKATQTPDTDFAAGPVFRFNGLAAGTYTLTVEAAGYTPAAVKVEITAGKPQQQVVLMTPKGAKP